MQWSLPYRDDILGLISTPQADQVSTQGVRWLSDQPAISDENLISGPGLPSCERDNRRRVVCSK
jgi:hypothetical protein